MANIVSCPHALLKADHHCNKLLNLSAEAMNHNQALEVKGTALSRWQDAEYIQCHIREQLGSAHSMYWRDQAWAFSTAWGWRTAVSAEGWAHMNWLWGLVPGTSKDFSSISSFSDSVNLLDGTDWYIHQIIIERQRKSEKGRMEEKDEVEN